MRKLFTFIVLLLFLVSCTQTTIVSEKQVKKTEEKVEEVKETPVQENLVSYKIGVMLPLTGDLAHLGQPSSNAVKLAVDDMNEKNGVKGHQIELVIEDSKCNPKEASTVVNKLISVDKVIAIIGEFCSSASLAAIPVAEQSKIPMISPASSNYKISDSGDYIFRTFPSDALQGKEGARIAHNLHYDKVALFYINNDYGVGLKEVFSNKIKELGSEVVIVEQHNQGDTDFKTQLAKIKAAKPDGIYLITYPAEGAILLKQAKELAIKVPVLGTETLKDESFLKLASGSAEGIMMTFPSLDKSSNEYVNFENRYKEIYGNDPAAYSPEAYDAAVVLMKALEISDGSSTGIKNALYTIQGHKGASGEISFDEKGDVEKPYSLYKVEKGKYVEANQ